MMGDGNKKQGRGWHKADDPTGQGHAEAGRKGGEKVRDQKGSVYYSQIGRKGGESRGKNKGQNQNTNPSQDQGGMMDDLSEGSEGTDRDRSM